MRISDWSSDVCSSDLARSGATSALPAFRAPGRCHTRHRTICHVSWFLLVTSWLPFVTQCSIVNQDDSPIRDKTSCQGSSRSEEHMSELQSLMRTSYAVFCLKKKNILHIITYISINKLA